MEELPCTLSACICDQFIKRSTFDSYSALDHATPLIALHQFFLDQFGIEFSFDPGESVLPSIMFESLDIHFNIPHCLPSALYSVAVGLNGTLEGDKLSNEMSSCIMDV